MSLIASEDTRTTHKLLTALGITNRPRLVALHDHNEAAVADELVVLAAEMDVLVLSDAGMPTVSDPGYHLVRAAVAAGVTVTSVPGPSAVITALAVSGLPTDRFTFEGFLPRKSGERRARFIELAHERRTMIFYESPNRLADALADARDAFGATRDAVVCRELTKKFEEVRRGNLAELHAWAAEGVRGEIVVLVHGASATVISLDSALAEIDALTASGMRLKEACAQVSSSTSLSTRDLYQAALARKLN